MRHRSDIGKSARACALAAVVALAAGCAGGPNPDLSLRGLSGVQVSMSDQIDWVRTPDRTRPLKIEATYGSINWGVTPAKRFDLAEEIEGRMGKESKVSNLRIASYSDPLQIVFKVLTLYYWEPRWIEVTGDVWLE